MSQIQIEQKIINHYQERFGAKPQALILAPGRVNLIGEYTDLNNGYVLPMAIDRYLTMGVGQREDQKICVHSIDFQDTINIDLDRLEKQDHSFREYITGCMWVLKEKGYPIKGFNAVISGNIPIGAGLSSSAALELAIIRAAAFSADFEFDQIEMARIAQLAENNWVGVSCGIMDQVMSAAGKEGHALLIDCNDLTLTSVPVPEKTSVIILDTNTRRGLVDSAYNERRTQCFEAAKIMGVPFLRDATLNMLEQAESMMDHATFKRAKHVILENQRVLDTVKAMRKGNAVTMGQLMNQSHESLKTDFQVSSQSLDSMVACSVDHPACFGARMTGAGFGGCALALIDQDKQKKFIEKVSQCYRNETGLTPRLYGCKPSSGVTLKKL